MASPSPFSRLATQISVFLPLAFGPLAGSTPALAQTNSLEIAAENGVQLVMRHAIAPGTGDPAAFTLGDCSTQRNLSDDGRKQARAIGQRLRENNIEIDVVLTSQWCRCRETAELLQIAPVEEAPFLNSFFRNRSASEEQTDAARARLRALARTGRKALLVTHQVNITALTGIYPSSGEIVLIRIGEDGEVSGAASIEN